MNKIISILIGLFLVFTISQVKAQCCNNEQKQSSNKTTMVEKNYNSANTSSFKVSGNCGMCKTRIEKAALSVSEVDKALWDSETGLLKTTHSENVSTHEIHKAVAKVGHSTETHKADIEAYKKLPVCCRYDK